MYHSLSFEDYCNGMVREENKSDGTVKVSGLSVVHSAMSSRNCYSFSLYHAKTVNMLWMHSVIVLTASKQSG